MEVVTILAALFAGATVGQAIIVFTVLFLTILVLRYAIRYINRKIAQNKARRDSTAPVGFWEGAWTHTKILWMIVTGLGLYYFTNNWYTPLQPFVLHILVFAVDIYLFFWAENSLFKNVDLYDEIITKKNLAYAVVLMGIVLLIGICTLATFAIFFRLA